MTVGAVAGDDPFADVLIANGEHAKWFTPLAAAGDAAKGLALLRCMDPRIDPPAMPALRPGVPKILGNAGGRGSGRVIALGCAAEGASVVVNDFGVSIDGNEPSSEVAQSVVDEIVGAGGTAVAVADDIATMAAGERIVQTAMDNYGRIDGV